MASSRPATNLSAIAAALGVSVATASNALSGKGRVSPELVERIRKTASELGYVPKQFPTLSDEQQKDVGEFLQSLDDHDDVHRVWAAVK